MTQRVVEKASGLLERRFPGRDFLLASHLLAPL